MLRSVFSRRRDPKPRRAVGRCRSTPSVAIEQLESRAMLAGNVAPTSIDLGNTEWLLWNVGGQIWRSKPDGTSQALIVAASLGKSITAFDIDKATGRIFFAEDPSTTANTKIYSAAIDGSDRKTVYDGNGLGRVNGSLTVDTAVGYLYLHSHDVVPLASQGPSYDGKVQRLNISAGNVTILPTSFWYAHDVQVSSNSQLYVTGFSDFTELSSRFYSQQLDGSANQEVPATGLATLNFALAERTNSVYVSTDSQSSTAGNVYRIPLPGGAPSLVFDGTQHINDIECEEPTGLLYWITNTGIYRSSTQGANAQSIVTGLNANGASHLSIVSSVAMTVPENAVTGTVVGLLSASDANTGDTFTYSLVPGTGSDDNANFQITNGQLCTKASFDYEARNSYTVRVRATDQGGLFTEKPFTIAVTNVNETPTDLTLSPSSLVENQPAGTTVGTLSTTDPDAGNIFTYSLVTGTGSTDNASFTIVGNALKTTATFDYETKNSYSIRVRSADANGLYTEKQLGITVSDVAELGTFLYGFKHVNEANADRYLIDSTGMRRYSEWQSPPITYWGPSANGSEGRLIYKFDFSATTTSIRLKADSPSWDFYTEPGGYGRGASALEASRDGSTWVSLRNSLEPRSWGADWSINDMLPASVLGTSQLFVRMRFYTENAPASSYTDAQFGRSTSQAVSNVFEVEANLSSANRAPTDIALSVSSIAENSPVGTSVGTLSTTDPDASDTFTYSLIPGTGSTDNAAFTIIGNALKTVTSINSEAKRSYSVRIRSTDAAGLFTEKQFTITVTDVNEVPTDISLSNFSIAENQPTGTVVSTLHTTDPDLNVIRALATPDGFDGFTYSLVPGTGSTDNAFFTIAGTTLKTAATFNYEGQSQYSIRIRSTDPGRLFTEKAFTITVTNVNEAPTDVALANIVASIPENMSTATRIRVADIVVDDDALGSNTLHLSGPDASIFRFVGSQFFVRAGTKLDYEARNTYSVKVTASDLTVIGSIPVSVQYAISITDVNEAPTTVTLANGVAGLPENTSTAIRIRVADILVTDDALGINTLSLSGPDASIFRFVGSQLFLRAGTKLDYEARTTYSVTVTASDPTLIGSIPVTARYAISITDVNEAPTTITLTHVVAGLSENTNTVPRIRVADILVTDDALANNTLSLSGPDASDFRIIGSQLFLRASTRVDYETKTGYSVTITASDPTLPDSIPISVRYTLSITDVNEAPSAVRLINVVSLLPENTDSSAGVKVAGVVVTDDGLGTNTLMLSGPDASDFELFGNELYLRKTTKIDYEAARSYLVVVTAADTMLPAAAPVSVSNQLAITDVNEPPTLLAAFTLTGGKRNTPLEITYAALLAASQARDPEGGSPSFLIETVNAGSVQRWTGSKWANVATSSPIAERMLGPGQKIRWVPPAGVTGVRTAFLVKAWDGQVAPTLAAQVSVSIT
jgi:hypothetical protein